MDAAERARTEDVAFQIADILNAGMSAETVVAVLEVIENIKQAARQDERRKVLERCAGICKQHAINAERRAAGHENVAALNAARDKQEAHEHDEATIRALAEEVT